MYDSMNTEGGCGGDVDQTMSESGMVPEATADTTRMVRDFVLLKSFDVVSSGQYRKFVLRKKDLCEQWAIEMHHSYHTLMLEVRNLAKYASLAKSQGHTEVSIVCTKLLNCVECPHLENKGWNTCTITKVQCIGGVRVNAESETTAIMVHPRFLRFCLAYWFTSRFEHVLRRLVRCKYTKEYCDDNTLSFITSLINEDQDIVGGVVNNFVHALKHVHATMQKLLGIQDGGLGTLTNFAI